MTNEEIETRLDELYDRLSDFTHVSERFERDEVLAEIHDLEEELNERTP